MQKLKSFWAGHKAEQVRTRRLNAQLENLTDYGLIERMLKGEVQ